MAGDTVITVIGNTVADPELRYTPSGAAVANFTIASTARAFDSTTKEWKDQPTLFMRCSVWRDPAENVAESLTRGMRVIASGRLKQRSYTTKEGEERTVVELDVDEVGPSLRYASAVVTKKVTGGGHRPPNVTGSNAWGGKPREAQSGPPSNEGWGQRPPAGQTQGSIPNQQLPALHGEGWGREPETAPF